ncbi:AbiH family protein [Chryseobacterium sp. TY4]
MNRLVLIGNGFDLAHGMKTSYHDFILNYLKEAFRGVFKGNNYEDNLIKVYYDRAGWKLIMNGNEVDSWTLQNFIDHFEPENRRENRVVLQSKSILIQYLFDHCKQYDWVDIENVFYLLLCKFASKNQLNEIMRLNQDLEFLKELLKEYLVKVENDFVKNDSEKFRRKDFVEQITSISTLSVQERKYLGIEELNNRPESILFLNFNYTDTIHEYFERIREKINNCYVINIHGKLNESNNPIIFGYGDESETNFSLLEKYDECLTYVKTYWYSRTNNYRKFLDFVNSGNFDVFVLGHSCGLSDKTLLSEVFNNKNCRKIRLLTYVKDRNKDVTIDNTDYISKTYQIGRVFQNKEEMRDKLIPFMPSDVIAIKSLKN